MDDKKIPERGRISRSGHHLDHANHFSLTDLHDDTLLSTSEAALALRVHFRTLEDWRKAGKGPRALKMERRYRYRVGDLLAYLDNAASVT